MVIEPETPVTGWCRGCDAAATKSVHAVGGHGWIVIWFCPRHCEAFQTDTVERREGVSCRSRATTACGPPCTSATTATRGSSSTRTETRTSREI